MTGIFGDAECECIRTRYTDRLYILSFVCATAKEITGITRLRSYSLPSQLDLPATVCEAALATSAATGFFDPVSIGARQFVDGALGANNPVEEVEGEAANIWCSTTGDLKPLLHFDWDGKPWQKSDSRQVAKVPLQDASWDRDRDGEYRKKIHS